MSWPRRQWTRSLLGSARLLFARAVPGRVVSARCYWKRLLHPAQAAAHSSPDSIGSASCPGPAQPRDRRCNKDGKGTILASTHRNTQGNGSSFTAALSRLASRTARASWSTSCDRSSRTVVKGGERRWKAVEGGGLRWKAVDGGERAVKDGERP